MTIHPLRNSDMIDAFRVAANSISSSPVAVSHRSGHRYIMINARLGTVGTTLDRDQASNLKDITTHFDRLIKDESLSLGEKRELINDFSKITKFLESTPSNIFSKIFGDPDKDIREARAALKEGNNKIKEAGLEIKQAYLRTIQNIATQAYELRGREPEAQLTDEEIRALPFEKCAELQEIIWPLTRPSEAEVLDKDLSRQLNKLSNQLMEARQIFNSKLTAIFGLERVDKEYLKRVDDLIK